jgi:hypothetical protein
LLPLTTNNDHWLLAVIVVDCVAVAMTVVDGGNSSHCQLWQQWDQSNGANDGTVDGGSS